MARSNWAMGGQFNKRTIYEGLGRGLGTIWDCSLGSALRLIIRT